MREKLFSYTVIILIIFLSFIFYPPLSSPLFLSLKQNEEQVKAREISGQIERGLKKFSDENQRKIEKPLILNLTQKVAPAPENAMHPGFKNADSILNPIEIEVKKDLSEGFKALGKDEKTELQEKAPESCLWSFLPIVTKHQGIFNGQLIDYSAMIEETFISDSKNGNSAHLVSIAYIREGVDDYSRRPVIFLFNGGPIVPSVYLHLGAFGPKRVFFSDDLDADPQSFHLIDNPYTVLDVADLVFFDPAGTGLSRVGEGTSPDAYFSVEEDSRQLTQFVGAWSRAHGRLDSPKYLFGESYGTIRAAVAARQISNLSPALHLNGVFLMGQALNIVETSSRPANIISYVVSLPTLAALGWYHGRMERGERTLEQFLDEVRLFARTDYLTALFQGSTLPPLEKERVAKKLEEFTGLPAEFYIQNNLRVSKFRFRLELLRDKGEVIGYYDGRYKEKQVKPEEVPDPSRKITSAIVNCFKSYAKEHLKLDVTNYIFNSPVKGLEGWKWNGTIPFSKDSSSLATTPFSDWPYMESLLKAMMENPGLRVVVGAGYHDLTTTIGASEFAVTQSGWPEERVRLVYYEGGHMAYSVEESLIKMMKDVRTLLLGGE